MWSHARLLLHPVGRDLTMVLSTQSLVQGIRDAVKGKQLLRSIASHSEFIYIGYWTAWQSNILHRDVSIGNIMLVDTKPFKGFLHHFNYSIDLGNRDSETGTDIEKLLKDMTASNSCRR
jgi:hypothetical protein